MSDKFLALILLILGIFLVNIPLVSASLDITNFNGEHQNCFETTDNLYISGMGTPSRIFIIDSAGKEVNWFNVFIKSDASFYSIPFNVEDLTKNKLGTFTIQSSAGQSIFYYKSYCSQSFIGQETVQPTQINTPIPKILQPTSTLDVSKLDRTYSENDEIEINVSIKNYIANSIVQVKIFKERDFIAGVTAIYPSNLEIYGETFSITKIIKEQNVFLPSGDYLVQVQYGDLLIKSQSFHMNRQIDKQSTNKPEFVFPVIDGIIPIGAFLGISIVVIGSIIALNRKKSNKIKLEKEMVLEEIKRTFEDNVGREIRIENLTLEQLHEHFTMLKQERAAKEDEERRERDMRERMRREKEQEEAAARRAAAEAAAAEAAARRAAAEAAARRAAAEAAGGTEKPEEQIPLNFHQLIDQIEIEIGKKNLGDFDKDLLRIGLEQIISQPDSPERTLQLRHFLDSLKGRKKQSKQEPRKSPKKEERKPKSKGLPDLETILDKNSNSYDILGLSTDTSCTEIKTRNRKLQQKYHPTKGWIKMSESEKSDKTNAIIKINEAVKDLKKKHRCS